MVDSIKAWQCVGCGKLEADAQCIGICKDVAVHLVSKADYDRLEAFVCRVAQSTPRDGQWQRSYLAIRQEARQALGLKDPEKEKAPLEAGL